jgi:hypothetical protein
MFADVDIRRCQLGQSWLNDLADLMCGEFFLMRYLTCSISCLSNSMEALARCSKGEIFKRLILFTSLGCVAILILTAVGTGALSERHPSIMPNCSVDL